MSEKSSSLLPDDATARDRLRAMLTVCLVVAVLLAGTVVPATSGAGLGETPLGSVLPTPGVNVDGPSGSGGGGTDGVGSSGGLGALNPGEQTSVGGSLGSNSSAFRSQNADVHFTVESSTPSYWRTGAYDTYTGSGWKQSGERRPYTGPVEGTGIRGERVEYRVTLNRSATALPSVWRANSVSQSATEELYVTDQRAFVTDDPLDSGTTYSGVSHLAPSDPTVLRTAGRDYPAEIEDRYTGLPDETEREVGGFTDNLTADSDSPYQTATRIESWLEANKNYSLNVSDPGEDVASQFLFEMEKGYCEYFATTMTVMLRSQDIPARYVVGYSTGQQVGANTYQVRGMNAHAWVEVYFPEVGWVKFDPTPGQARLQAEQRAYQNQTPDAASDYDPTEAGSPGEEFSPNGSTESEATPPDGTPATSGTGTATASGDGDASTSDTVGATGTPTESPTDATRTDERDRTTAGTGESGETTTETGETGDTTTRPPEDDDSTDGTRYEVELNRTPVPGATVEVSVQPRENATFVTGVSVYFNGEYVGETDETGTVTAEVPYAENLTITVGSQRDQQSVAVAGPPAGFDPPLAMTLESPPTSLAPGNDTDANRTDGDQTTGTEYSLATDATIAVSGDVETSSRVVVTASVQGVPVRNANVRLNGETVATTDANGRAEVLLPDSPGNATVSVSRGPVSGQTTVSIPRLAVAVEPSLPVALPWTGVEIRATYGGDPVSDARVRLGEETHSTDFDGSAPATLPFQRSADVVVTARGQTRRTTVSGLFVNLALVLGGAVVLVGGLGFGAYRKGFGPRRFFTALLAGMQSIPDLAVAALFGLADRAEWAIRTVRSALRDLWEGETTLSELFARFRAWLRERAEAARASAGATVSGDFDTTRPPGTDSCEPDDSYRTLREAWDSFLAVVSVRHPDSSTPGELADHAIREDDLPPGAVVTLRDAFRDVEYGARSPADRLARVEEAIETIERATREVGTDGTGATDDDSPSGGET